MIEFYNRFKAGTSVFGGPLFNGLLHDYLPASLYVGFESTESSFEKEFFFGLAITAVILLLLSEKVYGDSNQKDHWWHDWNHKGDV